MFSGVFKDQSVKRGISALINRKHKTTDFETVDENLIRVNITINLKPTTIISIYIISDVELYWQLYWQGLVLVKDAFTESGSWLDAGNSGKPK